GGPHLESINVGNLTSLRPTVPLITPTHDDVSPLQTPELDASAVNLIAERCPMLRDVCFNDVDEGMTIRVAVGCGKRLRSLKLCNVGGGVTDAGIWAVVAACPNLEVFRIIFGKVEEEVVVVGGGGGGGGGGGWEDSMDGVHGFGVDEFSHLYASPPATIVDEGDYPCESLTPPLTDTVTDSTSPPPTDPSTPVSDRSLTRLIQTCHKLIDFGCVGDSAPVSQRLIDAILTSPCSRNLRRLNLAASVYPPRELLESISGRDVLPREREEVGGGGEVVYPRGRIGRMVNGGGGEVDVLLGRGYDV
ncbi:hypothetical protein HDU67_007535, partial [Dinochytrium kinnereticum]